MRIIFAGTAEFAVPSLQAILDSPHQLTAVFTQPDRPAGRGQQLCASPVKHLTETHAVPVFQPKTLREQGVQSQIQNLQADVMVVVAYGLILPKAVLSAPKHGCLNVHPSLLPRWRGAAPIQRTIEAGDHETAISVMQMDEGMDTGPVLKEQIVPLQGNETSGQLHAMLAQCGAELLLDTLANLAGITPRYQNDAMATYARKLEKTESLIDWYHSAVTIERKIRALNPWPVACFVWRDMKIKIWEAKIYPRQNTEPPGRLFIEGKHVCIATADMGIEIISLQLPGKKIMSARDFIHGYGKIV